MVQRAVQARRVLDRLLGVPVRDQERPLAHGLFVFRHLLRLDPVWHALRMGGGLLSPAALRPVPADDGWPQEIRPGSAPVGHRG
jgi:hypothetical protein